MPSSAAESVSETPIRVLIIGASGQLGRELQSLLEGDTDIISDTPPHVDKGDGRVPLDITDADGVLAYMEATRPQVVVHLAAKTPNRDQPKISPTEFETVNVAGTASVLAAADAVGASVVFASSILVYEATNAPNRDANRVQHIQEHHPRRALAEPMDYETSKIISEDATLNAFSSRAKVVIARITWAHGKKQSVGLAGADNAKRLAGLVAAQRAGTPEANLPYEVVMPNEVRDRVSFPEVAAALRVLVRHQGAGTLLPAVVNVSSGVANSNLDFARELQAMAGTDFPYELVADVTSRHLTADNRRMRTFGWDTSLRMRQKATADMLDVALLRESLEPVDRALVTTEVPPLVTAPAPTLYR